MSPSKRKPDQLSDLETPDSGSSIAMSSRTISSRLLYRTLTWHLAQTSATSHVTDVCSAHASPPPKRLRAENTATTVDTSSYTPLNTPSHANNLSHTNPTTKSQTHTPQATFTTSHLPQSASQAPVFLADDRPHRNRQPTKKALNIN